MHIGPLGSTVHVIRADAETVAALAGIDWNRHFRRSGARAHHVDVAFIFP